MNGIIVDNSSDETGRMLLTERFPFLHWINMGYNAGFARANNTGMQYASSDVVLLLNPDTVSTNNSIDECLKRLKRSNDVACAVQLYNADGTPQITGNYFIKGALNNFLALPYLGKLMRRIAFALNTKKTNVEKANDYQKVDWINGAFLMIKKEVIKKAGMMDEDFFLYAEETEWCGRIRKYGNLVVYGDLEIIHKQGEIIGKQTLNEEKGYQNIFNKKGGQLLLSNILRVRKYYGVGWFIIHLLVYTFEIGVFAFFQLIQNIFTLKAPFKNFENVGGYIKNVITIWRQTLPILTKRKKLYKTI